MALTAQQIKDIRVGTVIRSATQDFVVTETRETLYHGYIEYKGKVHESILFKDNLTNNHYKNKYSIVQN